ncbi:hypothetical protein [Hahella chejuensis]|uniref:hypothetical protein n=1 Tax=Hahella chejuensis TaxID=158327 RepID=UPI0005A261B4|nr:hypothetical protein [Hahella chejuensis]
MSKSKLVFIDNKNYEWYATQNDEHPDFCLVSKEGGDIWVQVCLSDSEKAHSLQYLGGRADQAIPDETAKRIIERIIYKGYLKTYKDSDVGLIFFDGDLIEN